MTANVSLKQAVIGVEGFLIGTVDTLILRKDVEKLAEFLLGLIAIFNVDHVCCVGREHGRSMASFAKTLFEKGAGPSFSHISHRQSGSGSAGLLRQPF